jgi:hypothetical protein
LAASCGALFVLGIVIGDDTINTADEAPNPIDQDEDSIAEVGQYLNSAADAATSGNYWVGRGIGTLGLLALVVFAVYVSRTIREREHSGAVLSGIALGTGITAAAMGLISAAAQFAVVARANEGIDLEIARALLDFSGLAFVLMWLPIAAFLAATGAAGMRLAILPRWLAITAVVLAVGLASGLATMPASGAGFMAIVLSGLWFIAASVALARRSGASGQAA